MTTTTTARFGFARWGADSDSVQREEFVQNIDQVEAIGAQYSQAGTRPAPGVAGRFHRHPTTGVISYDDGTAWSYVGSAARNVAAQADGTAATPLSARGVTGQTADLQQWLNGAGSTLARVRADGLIHAASGLSVGDTLPDAGGGAHVRPLGASGVPLAVQAGASSMVVQRWLNSSGTAVATMSPTGRAVLNAGVEARTASSTDRALDLVAIPDGGATDLLRAATPGGDVIGSLRNDGRWFSRSEVLAPTSPTVVGHIVRGTAGQSAALSEWTDTAQTVLARMSPAGVLQSPTTTGGIDRAHRPSAQISAQSSQNVPTNTDTSLTLGRVDVRTDDSMVATANAIVVPVDGVYAVEANLGINPSSSPAAAHSRALILTVNGTTRRFHQVCVGATPAAAVLNANWQVALKAGDILRIQARTNGHADTVVTRPEESLACRLSVTFDQPATPAVA